VAVKGIAIGDKVEVHDSVSDCCGMSGVVERKVCHGVFLVRFSKTKTATFMSYQISKNGR